MTGERLWDWWLRAALEEALETADWPWPDDRLHETALDNLTDALRAAALMEGAPPAVQPKDLPGGTNA